MAAIAQVTARVFFSRVASNLQSRSGCPESDVSHICFCSEDYSRHCALAPLAFLGAAASYAMHPAQAEAMRRMQAQAQAQAAAMHPAQAETMKRNFADMAGMPSEDAQKRQAGAQAVQAQMQAQARVQMHSQSPQIAQARAQMQAQAQAQVQARAQAQAQSHNEEATVPTAKASAAAASEEDGASMNPLTGVPYTKRFFELLRKRRGLLRYCKVNWENEVGSFL